MRFVLVMKDTVSSLSGNMTIDAEKGHRKVNLNYEIATPQNLAVHRQGHIVIGLYTSLHMGNGWVTL